MVSDGKSFDRARMTALFELSPYRRGAPCPIFDACGGRQLQHWDYVAQLWVEAVARRRQPGAQRSEGK
ncbi:hypothetical protein [Cohnella sp. REN36]|uniref:hypothetical protein n=1 Tax=Cohnella sp. REN36 TaxID=2887347 RepID=UPI001D14A268|nr:hypothetical protein [Cohnella sp. REN36]MCC3372378.1 hypothetical protein [Cohnella sp. REN36]